MEWWLQLAGVVGLFVLRLLIPLAITVAVGFWLRRLDAKWQAEARARLAASRAQSEDMVEPELELFRVVEPPCWVQKDCPEDVYTRCPALKTPDIPCWLARYRTDGVVPAKCYRCQLFSRRQAERYFC